MELELNVKELYKVLENENCAFLCGNGFSINFDNDFANIYNRLHLSHKKVIHETKYNVKSPNRNLKKKREDNYYNLLRYIRFISERELIKIFEEALIFANSILNNKQLIKDLKSHNLFTELTFGISELDILKSICSIGNDRGIKFVNIENWTILVYFYHIIEILDIDYYQYPSANSFISLIKVGNKNKTDLINHDKKSKAIQDTIFNGFITYYRMLFSTAIFSNGKAVAFDMLNNVNKLNLQKISSFLNKFDLIMTLNYDHIIENLINKDIEHLHGKFLINRTQYVYNQNLILNIQNGFVDFTDILIGDYFTFKSNLATISTISNQPPNKKIETTNKKIDKMIKKHSTSTIVIFGVDIENDYHILRNLMLGLYSAKINEPHIIYCYFSETGKRKFDKYFRKLITFNEDASNYSQNIKISYMKTKDMLNEIFYKPVV